MVAEEIISRLKRHGILKWKQIAVVMNDYVYRVNAYLWNHQASIATCFQWTLNANTELGLSASLGSSSASRIVPVIVPVTSP